MDASCGGGADIADRCAAVVFCSNSGGGGHWCVGGACPVVADVVYVIGLQTGTGCGICIVTGGGSRAVGATMATVAPVACKTTGATVGGTIAEIGVRFGSLEILFDKLSIGMFSLSLQGSVDSSFVFFTPSSVGSPTAAATRASHRTDDCAIVSIAELHSTSDAVDSTSELRDANVSVLVALSSGELSIVGIVAIVVNATAVLCMSETMPLLDAEEVGTELSLISDFT